VWCLHTATFNERSNDSDFLHEIHGSKWLNACHSLERNLRQREIIWSGGVGLSLSCTWIQYNTYPHEFDFIICLSVYLYWNLEAEEKKKKNYGGLVGSIMPNWEHAERAIIFISNQNC
jgi:hypothetical protein